MHTKNTMNELARLVVGTIFFSLSGFHAGFLLGAMGGILYVTYYMLCTRLDGDSFYETRKSLEKNCQISL